MRITRHQLRRIIKEEIQRLDEIPTYIKNRARQMGVPHMGSAPGPRQEPTVEDPHGDEAEFMRGFIDGYEGNPEAQDATADYDIGFERGSIQFNSDDEKGLTRDPEDILGGQNV